MEKIEFDPRALRWLPTLFSPPQPVGSLTAAATAMIRAHRSTAAADRHLVAWKPHAAFASYDLLMAEDASLIAFTSEAPHAGVRLTLLRRVEGATVVTGAAVTSPYAAEPDVLDPTSRWVDSDPHDGRLTLGFGFRRGGRDYTLELHGPRRTGDSWSGALVVHYQRGDRVKGSLIERLTAAGGETRSPRHRKIEGALIELDEPASIVGAFGERVRGPAAAFDLFAPRLPLSQALRQLGQQPQSGLARRP